MKGQYLISGIFFFSFVITILFKIRCLKLLVLINKVKTLLAFNNSNKSTIQSVQLVSNKVRLLKIVSNSEYEINDLKFTDTGIEANVCCSFLVCLLEGSGFGTLLDSEVCL